MDVDGAGGVRDRPGSENESESGGVGKRKREGQREKDPWRRRRWRKSDTKRR